MTESAAVSSTTFRPRDRVRSMVAVGLSLALVLFLCASLFILIRTDPDYWWHVRTGQYIVETFSLPRGDIYSHTVPGRSWVTHEWLTEVLLFLVQRTFGFWGNAILFAGFTFATAVAVFRTCRLRGSAIAASMLLAGFALLIGVASYGVRPQLLTALLLAITALQLTHYRMGRVKPLWLLPPLLALWVNLHGGYVIGLALLALTLAGEAVAQVIGRKHAPLRPLLLVTVASALATLASPHGLAALTYPFSYAGTGNASMQYIQEWQSPNFHQPTFAFLVAGLLLALVLGLGRRPLSVTDALWGTALAFLALRSSRHVPLFGIVVAPLLGARLQAEWSSLSDWPVWHAIVRPGIRRSLSGPQRKAVLFAALGICLLLTALTPQRSTKLNQVSSFSREPSAARYPVGGVNYILDHNLQGNLFNEYEWGGYLIYRLYPQRRVFVDGRADVYGDTFLEDYVTIFRLKPQWREVLERYDVSLVLVPKDGPLAAILREDPGWQVLYTGEIEQLLSRRDSN